MKYNPDTLKKKWTAKNQHDPGSIPEHNHLTDLDWQRVGTRDVLKGKNINEINHDTVANAEWNRSPL